MAAAEHVGLQVRKTHWDTASVAETLHERHGLPRVAELPRELNELRKGFSYGEPGESPTMSAEDIAMEIERYVVAVFRLVEGGRA